MSSHVSAFTSVWYAVYECKPRDHFSKSNVLLFAASSIKCKAFPNLVKAKNDYFFLEKGL